MVSIKVTRCTLCWLYQDQLSSCSAGCDWTDQVQQMKPEHVMSPPQGATPIFLSFSSFCWCMTEMAATTISVEQDQFSCSVCLEVLRDPVTIPCGHSYCLDCIEDYWNRVKQKSQYSCPQCRQVFNPKPLLSRNTVLGEVVEKFQQTGSQGAVQHLTNPTEVKCSICKGRQSKAVKSCLVCLDSYCASHLKVHEERHHGKTHRLIPATDELRARLCPQHDKVVRLYCRTDQLSVCSQCVRERHMGHDCVSVAHERTEQQVCLSSFMSIYYRTL